jgi:hypothetical protein
VVQGTRDRGRLIAFVAETASRNGILFQAPESRDAFGAVSSFFDEHLGK